MWYYGGCGSGGTCSQCQYVVELRQIGLMLFFSHPLRHLYIGASIGRCPLTNVHQQGDGVGEGKNHSTLSNTGEGGAKKKREEGGQVS